MKLKARVLAFTSGVDTREISGTDKLTSYQKRNGPTFLLEVFWSFPTPCFYLCLLLISRTLLTSQPNMLRDLM